MIAKMSAINRFCQSGSRLDNGCQKMLGPPAFPHTAHQLRWANGPMIRKQSGHGGDCMGILKICKPAAAIFAVLLCVSLAHAVITAPTPLRDFLGVSNYVLLAKVDKFLPE